MAIAKAVFCAKPIAPGSDLETFQTLRGLQFPLGIDLLVLYPDAKRAHEKNEVEGEIKKAKHCYFVAVLRGSTMA